MEISLDTLVGVDNAQSQIEIDAQLQSLVSSYSIVEKDAILAIFRDIERFSAIITEKQFDNCNP